MKGDFDESDCMHKIRTTRDVLKLKEIEKPTPGDDEVLVEVHAASVTYSNLMLVRGEPFVGRLMGMGLLKPKQQDTRS